MIESSDLVEMVVRRLSAYERIMKSLPERIIIYRDGVSEVYTIDYRHRLGCIDILTHHLGAVFAYFAEGVAPHSGCFRQIQDRKQRRRISSHVIYHRVRQAPPCKVSCYFVRRSNKQREHDARHCLRQRRDGHL